MIIYYFHMNTCFILTLVFGSVGLPGPTPFTLFCSTDNRFVLDITASVRRQRHHTHTVDIRQIYGGYTVVARHIYAGHTANIWQLYGNYTADMRQIYGRYYTANMRLIYAKYTANISKLLI